MRGWAIHPGWQTCNVAADLLFGQSHVVKTLEVHPECWAGAEPMPKPEGGVAGDRPLSLDDLANPIVWHTKLTRQLRGADTEFGQFVSQHFAGVNGGKRHG